MRKKARKTEKALICVLAGIFVVTGGFMGIEKFAPEERSLEIFDDVAVVSEPAAADEEKTAAEEKANGLKIDAKAAVLIDGVSGRVLFAQNEKKHLPPASVTKVMTLLLIFEGCETGKISMDDKVTVSERAAKMGGSQMYMEQGEQHTVEELLKGVIMASANDGAVALAEHLAGSVENFVDMMNARAEKMGLEDSHFVNTNGLPVADHYSCAYDIGMISKELMRYDKAHKWFTTWQEDIEVGLPGKENKFTLTNTNKLIRNYDGAIGIKTGYTRDAGYCLSGAAQRGTTRMIGVVLGCKTSEIRFNEMEKLLNYGFANYETVRFAKAGQKAKKVRVDKGNGTYLYAVTENDIGLTVDKENRKNVKKRIVIENIKLPVKKGQKVGDMILYEGKKQVAAYDLVSDRDIDKADFVTTYIRMIKKLI